MTVEELIEELQRMPNKRVPVRARVTVGDYASDDHAIESVTFQGATVEIDIEDIPLDDEGDE